MNDVIKAAHSEHEDLHPTHRKKILADLDYATIAERLVRCATNVRLPELDLKIPKEPRNRKYLENMKKDYGLGTSVDRLFSSFQW